jgi:hypothetical protein
MRAQTHVIAGALCAMAAAATALQAQARFEILSRDAVAVSPAQAVAVPGLQIVTVRDNAIGACYTVFVMDPPRSAESAPRVDTSSVDAAAARRDRQLADLTGEFDRALASPTPGTLGPSSLRYELEGQKIQSDFDRTLREQDVARIERRLEQMAQLPRMAVSGPAACPKPAAP